MTMHPLRIGRLLPVAVAAAILSLVASSCVVSKNPVTGNRRAYAYSWQEEVELGEQADQQIVAQYGVYEDEDLQGYVERVGEEVLAESHLRREDTDEQFRETPFTFRVLDSPVINAFALPGGYVYLTRGILSHLNNEAQLAVVLGHEIGHVAARHASQQAVKQQFAQIGLLGGAILGQEVIGGAAGEAILNLGGTAAQLLFLSYSRDNERESDNLGVEYAARAGYQASEGAAFFEVLQRISQQEGGGIPTWQSTHPDPGERHQRILELAEEWAPRTDQEVVDADAYYGAIDGMVMGENPRNGFVEGQTFYHPDLRFQFPVPADFNVQNTAAQVALIQEDGEAVIVFQIARENTAREAAATFAAQEGVDVSERTSTQINGHPAQSLTASAQTEQGQQVRLQVLFIDHRDNVYSFIGYTLADRFSQYRQAFLQTMQGFDDVTDSDILNVQPMRLEVHRAQQSAPFRTFVPNALPENMTPEDLAILNQVELDTRIEAGRRLKLPRR